MEREYLNLKNPGGFGGIKRLFDEVRKRNKKVNIEEVKSFLSSQDAYTLHRQKRYKFKRNQFIIQNIDDLWQADLADISSLAPNNDGFKYILLVIDCLSKFVWLQPQKSKTGSSTLSAIKSIIERANPRKPSNFLVDKGGEFRSTALKQYMSDNGINFYTTQNPDTKAAIAERAIRTIKGRIFRYLTAKNTLRYIDVLDDVAEGYNKAKHRSIKMAPAEVTKDDVKK